MASTPPVGDEATLNFERMFAQGQKPESKAAANGEENLDELEAFLDEFEKNLEGDIRSLAEAPPQATGTPETSTSPVVPTELQRADLTTSSQGQEPVEELLKESDVEAVLEETVPADAPGEVAPVVPPAPAAPMGGDRSAGAPKTPVSATAGFRRNGFVVALVVGGMALLLSLVAGWMAWQANNALQEAESRLNGTSVSGPSAARLTQLQNEVTALRQKVEELTTVVEGPIGHLADSYAHDVEQLQARLTQLETATAPRPAASPGTAGKPQPQVASKTEASAAEKVPVPAAQVAKNTAPWLVHLSSWEDKKGAERDVARAHAAGISSQVTTAQLGGKTWYRVTTLKGFSTPEGARAYVAKEAKNAGFGKAWIGRR